MGRGIPWVSPLPKSQGKSSVLGCLSILLPNCYEYLNSNSEKTVMILFIILLWGVHYFCSMYSYQLSKELEPDDVPSSLYVAEPSLSSLSPARIRRALRHVFNTKGNIVGDSSPSPPIVQRLSRNNKLAPLLSERDILSTIDGPDENDRTHISNTLVITVDDEKKMERSMSASPEMRGRDRNNSAPEISPMGHVVRVATVNHDHCNYVSLLVRDHG